MRGLFPCLHSLGNSCNFAVKYSGGLENSQKLCKPPVSQFFITVSYSPNQVLYTILGVTYATLK